MKHVVALVAAIAAFSTSILISNTYADNIGGSASSVQARLQALDQWLGEGANSQRWHEYLNLDVLAAQLRQPAAPNRDALIDVLGRLESGAPGLDRRQFADLRQALAAWIDALPRPPKEALPEAVAKGQQRFRPVSEAEYQTSANKLRQAVERLDRYLGQSANGKAWREYLEWEQLQALASDEPPAAPEQAYNAVQKKLKSERPGLSLPVFTAVRQALADYRSKLLIHQNPNTRQEAAESLEFLAEKLREFNQAPSQQLAYEIGQVLGWLDVRKQSPQIVADVRRYYRYPNVYLQMSEPLIDVGMTRSVDRCEPVHDWILGARITGTSHTVGRVSADVIPSAHTAMIDSMLNANATSRTVGRKDTATVHSAGHTNLQARKRIYFDEYGIMTVPATADAVTRTRTLSVDSGRGGILIGHIADRIARQRVAESKSQSERISAEHAEDRLRNRVEREATPDLYEANEDFKKEVRWALLDEGVMPEQTRFSSSDYYVFANGVEANEFQLAALTGPPPLRLPNNDVALRLHESALNNMADMRLAGKEVEQTEFQDWYKDRFGELPEELESDPDKVPWTITFEEARPISVTFGINEVVVTLRVRRVEGSVSSRRRWEISAVYKLEKIPGGLRGVRQGSIEVIPPGYKGEGLSGSAAAERGNIQREFEDLLKDTFEHTGLELPGEWGDKAGKLPLVEASSGYGWMVLGWVKP
jgi:hypothetical protein